MQEQNQLKEPTQEEIEEFTSHGENSPHTNSLSKEEQNSILQSIANAECAETKPIEYEEGDENCLRCGKKSHYKVVKGDMVAICTECGKPVPICSRCPDGNRMEEVSCDNCILLDVATFINHLMGNISIEAFLGNLNPPLRDMTTTSVPLYVPKYEDYINDLGDGMVNWDLKYWDAYKRIKENGLTIDSPQSDIISFVKSIVNYNLGKAQPVIRVR